MHDVEIPGGTATLRDRQDMKVRHRKVLDIVRMEPAAESAMIKAASAYENGVVNTELMSALEFTAAEREAMRLMQHATILISLASWTIDDPLPVTIDDVEDMSLDVYNALEQLTSSGTAEALVGETDFEAHPDRSRPTKRSGASGRSSKAARSPRASTSPRSRPRGSGSTSTASSTAA